MIKTLEKRLQVLEKIAQDDLNFHSIWIEMIDRRVDEYTNMSKSKQDKSIFNFPSVKIASIYVENVLNDSGPNVTANISISDLREFFMMEFEDPEFGALFNVLLPDEKILVYLTLRKTSDEVFNLKAAILYTACKTYFNTWNFHTRYKTNQFSDHDERFFNAMLMIYQKLFPNNDSNAILDDFSKFIYLAGGLDRVYPPCDN
jgi:hypothetical protein